MRRRDLREGMRVVLCSTPWARRVLRDTSTWDVPEERWSTRYGALLACSDARVQCPQEYWDRNSMNVLVKVGKSQKVLVTFKTYNQIRIKRKKTRREEVWMAEAVSPVEILMTMENFFPIQDKILKDYRKLLVKMSKKAEGDPIKFPSKLSPLFA